MITPEHEEAAALYALDLLDPGEAARFEEACARDHALAELAEELQHCAAQLAGASPPAVPPAAVWDRIQAEIGAVRPESETGPPAVEKGRIIEASFSRWIPWALAAALAVCCGVLLFQKEEPAGSEMNFSVAVLQSTGEESPIGEAVVVWDPATQTGRLDLARMPVLGDEKDYQLWVIDPQYTDPVDGGVFRVDAEGAARWTFHPKAPVRDAQKFAISVEPQGGSAKARGPIVMASR